MRLLVTRPSDDSLATAAVLRARGHTAVIAPLMHVRFYEGPQRALSGVQAVLATSANGVRALATRSARRDVPFYAVGPQTADAARRAGFTTVRSAEGDSNALADIAAAELDPANGSLLHAAGAETAGRLRQALQARGFTVESEILYDAVPVSVLPPEAAQALRDDALDGVLLYSPRSAKIFAVLVGDAGLAEKCARLDAFCISAATATALGPLAFARVAVAGAPNQDGMLALIPESPV
jgi:uroporphyrinogen-III synthase